MTAQKSKIRINFWILICIFGFWFLILTLFCYAQEKQEPIEVNADRVEYLAGQNQMTAEGNVLVFYGKVRLSCDKLTVNTKTKDAQAEGHAVLEDFKDTPEGQKVTTVEGEKMTYNFQTKKGTVLIGNFISKPFYGKATKFDRVNERYMKAKNGYFTTCDKKFPHYRISARRMDIYPGDMVKAYHVLYLLGNVPLLYLPTYTQNLQDKMLHVQVQPGKDKIWGLYVLTAWRYYLNENAKGRIHLDYREKKDLATGVDLFYNSDKFGKGAFREYYMKERNITDNHIWERLYKEHDSTMEKERFRIQWRHNWDIDDNTKIIAEYNKEKDIDFLKDYFLREYEKTGNGSTYFLFSRALPTYNFSFYTQKRVNRFNTELEKLPELKFDIPSQRVLDILGFKQVEENKLTQGDLQEAESIVEEDKPQLYFNSENTFSNLFNRPASPTDILTAERRFDMYNKLSLPHKVFFIETTPYVAQRETYFSKDNYSDSDVIRSKFYSGVDMSTKFYRLFEVDSNFLGIEIHRLRHIITPTANYSYSHKPSMPSSKLLIDDGLGNRENQFSLGIENKLQTKRNKTTVDFVRFLATAPYLFKPKTNESGHLDDIALDLETLPYNWLHLDSDSVYSPRSDYFKSVNLDIKADGGDDWSFGLGTRYQRKVSRETTLEGAYRLSPKLKLRAYERIQHDALKHGIMEQDYTVWLDLHCWVLQINYNVRRRYGETLWFSFILKAFPEQAIVDYSTNYHNPKAGSQSSMY